MACHIAAGAPASPTDPHPPIPVACATRSSATRTICTICTLTLNMFYFAVVLASAVCLQPVIANSGKLSSSGIPSLSGPHSARKL